MAEDLKKGVGGASGQNAGSKGAAGTTVARKRKEYDHEMSEPERFALQTVQRAQSALRTINDAIKSGKTVKKEIVQLCFDLSKAAGDMLFSDG